MAPTICARLWIPTAAAVLIAGCGDDLGATGGDPTTGTTSGSSSGLPTTGALSSFTGASLSDATTFVPDPETGEPGDENTSGDVGSTGAPSDVTGVDATGTGGYESSGGVGSTSDAGTGDAPGCPLVLMHAPCDGDSDDPLHAIGVGCTSLGGAYVDKQNAVTAQDPVFMAAPAQGGKRPWQVAQAYGSHIDPDTQAPYWSPREGEKLLLISSGLLPAPDDTGAVIIAGNEVYNDVGGAPWDDDLMPPPMSHEPGSPDPQGFQSCDGAGDCSNTLAAQWALGGGDPNDRMWFGFQLTAPSLAAGDLADANGYSFDFAFFSAEFPEWVDTPYNDVFVVWQSSEGYTGNVTFIAGQPLTVTALWPIEFHGECNLLDPGCQGQDPHLEGTGHSNTGGATGWYRATGGVQPGETFGLAFAVFDMGDSTYDTTAIVDRWQWDCEGCVPSDVDSCGVTPQ